jgi:hypothetical protein
MDASVGTRPESVVNRRGRLDRGSWEETCCIRREPLRGGETKELILVSCRGDCCERNRRSSMVG